MKIGWDLCLRLRERQLLSMAPNRTFDQIGSIPKARHCRPPKEQ